MSTKTNKKPDVKGLMDQIQTIGSSIVYLAKDTSDNVISELEKSGLLSEADGKEMATEIKGDLKKRKTKLYNRVMDHLGKVVDDLGIERKKK